MKEISRRKFLKGAAGVSVSAAAAGILGGTVFASDEPDAVTGASPQQGGASGGPSGGSGESVPVELPDFLTPPDPIDEAEIREKIRPLMRALPRGQQISQILITDEALPRTATGKIKRWELQQKVSLQP